MRKMKFMIKLFLLLFFLSNNIVAQEIGNIKIGKYYNKETSILEGENTWFNTRSIYYMFSTYYGTFSEKSLLLRVIKIENNSEVIYESSNYDVEPDWDVTWDRLTLPYGEYKIKFYNDDGKLLAKSSNFIISSEYNGNQNSSSLNYLENQLYFVEEYTKEGIEVGRSSKFYIKRNGGYITAMLRTAQPIGVNTVDVWLERETSEGSEIIDSVPYDITSTKSYFFFDKITFYRPGNYTVTVLKKDGTIIALGKVRIEFEN